MYPSCKLKQFRLTNGNQIDAIATRNGIGDSQIGPITNDLKCVFADIAAENSHINACSTDDRVVVGSTDQTVIAIAPKQRIVSSTTFQNIITTTDDSWVEVVTVTE